MSKGKDIGRILNLVLKLTPIHYFSYIVFHTYPKIMKVALLETRCNKLSGREKKESLKIEVRHESYDPNKSGSKTRPESCQFDSGPLVGNPARLPFFESFSS